MVDRGRRPIAEHELAGQHGEHDADAAQHQRAACLAPPRRAHREDEQSQTNQNAAGVDDASRESA